MTIYLNIIRNQLLLRGASIKKYLYGFCKAGLSKKYLFAVILALSITMLFFNNCSVIKSQGSDITTSTSASQVDLSLLSDLQRGQLLYNNNCANCHGAVAISAKLRRTEGMITEAIRTVPQMSGASTLALLSASDINLISRALNPEAIPTTSQGGRQVFVCDATSLTQTPILKLTNREFRTSLNALVNDFSASATTQLSNDSQLVSFINSIPSDSLAADRFSNKEQNFLLTQRMQDAIFDSAFRAGELVSSATTRLNTYANTNGCLSSATITSACHRLFVSELASRAFRRPISTTEANSLATSLWDGALSKQNLITLTFTSIVQMPDFMYRIYDLGTQSTTGSRILNLTAHELASKLSFMLVGQPPDTELRSLAASGQILNDTILSQQVDRLLALPQSRDTIIRLFKESYGYDKFDAFNYSPAFLNGLTSSGLSAAMTSELDQFFTQTVLTQNGSFRDLLSSRMANITHVGLGQIYGVQASGNVTLPEARAGFINRAAFLAKKSGNYPSPVKRGLAVLENILCEDVGNPPPNAPTSVTEEQIVGQYHTTRQRYATLSEQPGSACIQCHSRINSIGYTFEQFDSIGRYRTMENIYTSATSQPIASLPVNSESQILDLRATPTFVRDSVDLADEVSTNDKAMVCFVRHLKTFESRRPAAASDGCHNNKVLSSMYGANGQQGSIKDVIKTLILAEEFKLWSY
jgi:hypothetical protein